MLSPGSSDSVSALSFAMSQFTCPDWFESRFTCAWFKRKLWMVKSSPLNKSLSEMSVASDCMETSVSLSNSPIPTTVRPSNSIITLGKLLHRLRLKSVNSTLAFTLLLMAVFTLFNSGPLKTTGKTTIAAIKRTRIAAMIINSFFIGSDFYNLLMSFSYTGKWSDLLIIRPIFFVNFFIPLSYERIMPNADFRSTIIGAAG